jgi:hypothetical protein
MTVEDLERLRQMDDESEIQLEGKEIFISLAMESFERLAAGGFVTIIARGSTSGGIFIRSRVEAPPASNHKFSVRRTHKGGKLLTMIDAGRALTEKP